jgi:Tfp pilus assembly protein FimT
MLNFNKKGISVVEILIVVAVLGVILSVVIPQFSRSRENQVLKNAVTEILSDLDKAKAQTLASIDSSSYGVRFESDKVIIFKGTAFLVDDASNEITEIVSPASISNVTLGGMSGNSGELYFNRLSGMPSKNGTITISSPSFSKIITISAMGTASTN